MMCKTTPTVFLGAAPRCRKSPQEHLALTHRFPQEEQRCLACLAGASSQWEKGHGPQMKESLSLSTSELKRSGVRLPKAQLSTSLLGELAATGCARTWESGTFLEKVVLACPSCNRELPGASLGDAVTCWGVCSCSVLRPIKDSAKRRDLMSLCCVAPVQQIPHPVTKTPLLLGKAAKTACTTAADEGDAAEIKKGSL